MKKTIIFLTFLSFIAFKNFDVFSDLGITKDQAQENILNSFTNGYLNLPAGCRKIALANRAAILQNIGAFAKSYSKTEDFKKRYADWWKDQEPTKPESPEARVAREKAELEENTKNSAKDQKEMLENMKKQIAETKDASIKKQLQDALKMTLDMQEQMKKQMASPEYQQQIKQMQETMVQVYADEYKTKMEEYTTNFANWKAIQNPNVLIKRQLEKFLEISSTVDFNAQLKTENGRKQFVNEEYQQKDDNWKRCFRAGKPATDAARNISQEWLKEL